MNSQDEIKAMREKWEHEDQLINHRLTWLLTSQALLFAGYGAIAVEQKRHEDVEHILDLLPWVGILSCVAIFVGIAAACAAMVFISEDADKTPGVNFFTTVCGWLAAMALPSIFGFGWLCLLTQSVAFSLISFVPPFVIATFLMPHLEPKPWREQAAPSKAEVGRHGGQGDWQLRPRPRN